MQVVVVVYYYMPRAISQNTTIGVARAALKISAKQLADRSKVGLSTIQKIEQGKHALTIDTARKLAMGLMVDPSWLLYGSPKDGPKWYDGKPWTAEGATKVYSELKAHSLWDEEAKKAAEHVATSISNSFRSLASRAVKNGTIFTLGFEFQAFLRTIIDTTNVYSKEEAEKMREVLGIESLEKKPKKKPAKPKVKRRLKTG
jgi:transcriptional regulator with XRE-family HTH domain